ncbi:MAG TPA: hypothetical protein VL027_14555 [Spongiibacteraceae bacterium]|nr:hypothetical protein [Spongiibacteraceae bacterium]
MLVLICDISHLGAQAGTGLTTASIPAQRLTQVVMGCATAFPIFDAKKI